MTTNPETAGVEPVACPMCKAPCIVERDDPTVIEWKDECGKYHEQHLGRTKYRYAHPPAARKEGEAICEACDKPCHEDRLHVDGNGFMACAAAFTEDGSGDCPNEVCAPSDSAPIFDGVNLETVIATSLASGNDVQPYEVAMAVRAALATTRPAPEQAPDHRSVAWEDMEEVIHALGQMLWPDTRCEPEDVRKYAIEVYKNAAMRHAAEQVHDSNLSASADELIAQAKPLLLPAPDHANCAVGEGEPTPEPTPQQGLGEGLVERAKAAMLANLRDRRLLKWLFAENADSNPVPIGYVDGPIDEATQDEIVETLARLTLAAMPTPAAIRAETTAGNVAWLRAKAAEKMALKEEAHDYVTALLDAADVLSRGDHLTGGAE